VSAFPKKEFAVKNTIKFIGITAIVAVIGLVIAACANPAGGGPAAETYTSTGGGNTYVLSITKPRAANGDDYTLTVSGTNPGQSTGKVTVLSGAYKLTPSNSGGGAALTVTISAGGMTFINGAITYDGGGALSVSVALTPVTSGGGAFTSVAAFSAWLNAQPANTAAAPYSVRLNIGQSDLEALKNALYAAATPIKYVSLDLSGSAITYIGGGAFFGCGSLTGVTIPNGVTSIGNGAFSWCVSLTSVTIPNSVTIIGNSAFASCDLTAITIPNSVTSIGSGAFSRCFSLTSVTIPNSVTRIAMDAFINCNSLTSVTIPSSVTFIGYQAFFCDSLTSVTFQGTIPKSSWGELEPGDETTLLPGMDISPFYGDLGAKFYATDAANGTPGTYTRPSGGTTWTKS
jgi:hypothetical protein